ncbi:hypothetical protein SMCF_1627, partial [Streptomyces coelicoflavus ZG0656]
PRGAALLPAHPATCDAVAELLGCTQEWADAGRPGDPGGSGGGSGVALLTAHPAACDALAGLLGCDEEWDSDGGCGSPARGAVLAGRHPAAAAAWEAVLARA